MFRDAAVPSYGRYGDHGDTQPGRPMQWLSIRPGPLWVGILLLLLLLLMPAVAHGQETGQSGVAAAAAVPGRPVPAARAEAWRALREQKARDLEPPKTSLPSKISKPFREFFEERRGFKPVLHGGHQSNSPAIGIRYEKLALGHSYVREKMPNRADFRAEAVTSADGHNHVEAEIGIHRPLSLPLSAALVTDFERHPHDDFYGLGPDSQLTDRSTYKFTTAEGGVRLDWPLARWLRLEGGAALVHVSTGPGGDGSHPSISEVFSVGVLPAFAESTDFVRAHARVEIDWRDGENPSHAGGLIAFDAENYEELSVSRFDFRRYRAEVQQHFPFFHEQRVIALRALTVITEPHDDGQVPFYFMPTLGHGDALRGFSSFRFRDRHALLLQGEYRWLAWKGLETALFLDAGKVFADLDELDLADLETAYGIGFRVITSGGTFFRLDIARSRERIRPHVSFSHVF